MFNKLSENLDSIDTEIGKLRSAVTHIEKSKDAAQKAITVAETTNREFKDHLVKVTASVESILEPHKNLIAKTEALISLINQIDIPARIDAQDAQIKSLKTLLFILCGVLLACTVATIIILKK